MSKRSDEVPAWIEEKVFEKVLHESVGDFSRIINFKASHALPPGENYATVIIKVEVEVLLTNGDIRSPSFMLKVSHGSELFKKISTKFNMFCTEAGMYREIVPEFEDLYGYIGVKVKFGARFYELPIQEQHILLEDLSQVGFRNAPRQNCLDMEHCKAVLKKLAQWHAASAVRFENKGSYEYKYSKGIFLESSKEFFTTMMSNTLKHFINAAKKLPINVEYISDLEALTGKISDLFYEQSSFDINEFNVLNHGDCWSNNIMFQYDPAGKLRETYFVDLQVPSYGSPARDLLYFIFTSAQLEIKINKYDYMIKYYYDYLIEHLKLLKYGKALPQLRQLHMSLLRQSCYALFATLLTLPIVLCDPTKEASVDNLVGDSGAADKFKEIMFSNERYLKHLEVLLPWLYYRGVFQIEH